MNGDYLKVDTQKLREIASNIEKGGKVYDENFNLIYSEFKDLGTVWSGKDYDAANVKMTANHPALSDLGQTIHNISKALLEIADGYDQLIKKSASQFE